MVHNVLLTRLLTPLLARLLTLIKWDLYLQSYSSRTINLDGHTATLFLIPHLFCFGGALLSASVEAICTSSWFKTHFTSHQKNI